MISTRKRASIVFLSEAFRKNEREKNFSFIDLNQFKLLIDQENFFFQEIECQKWNFLLHCIAMDPHYFMMKKNHEGHNVFFLILNLYFNLRNYAGDDVNGNLRLHYNSKLWISDLFCFPLLPNPIIIEAYQEMDLFDFLIKFDSKCDVQTITSSLMCIPENVEANSSKNYHRLIDQFGLLDTDEKANFLLRGALKNQTKIQIFFEDQPFDFALFKLLSTKKHYELVWNLVYGTEFLHVYENIPVVINDFFDNNVPENCDPIG